MSLRKNILHQQNHGNKLKDLLLCGVCIIIVERGFASMLKCACLGGLCTEHKKMAKVIRLAVVGVTLVILNNHARLVSSMAARERTQIDSSQVP